MFAGYVTGMCLPRSETSSAVASNGATSIRMGSSHEPAEAVDFAGPDRSRRVRRRLIKPTDLPRVGRRRARH